MAVALNNHKSANGHIVGVKNTAVVGFSVLTDIVVSAYIKAGYVGEVGCVLTVVSANVKTDFSVVVFNRNLFAVMEVYCSKGIKGIVFYYNVSCIRSINALVVEFSRSGHRLDKAAVVDIEVEDACILVVTLIPNEAGFDFAR